MGNRNGRLAAIADIVKSEGSASISEIARRFQVTTMTIRRDMAILSTDGLVKVYHGVAVPVRSNIEGLNHYAITQAEGTRVPEKTRIARAAAALVEPGDTVIFDAGTTTELTVRLLPPDIAIKIICFSLNVFSIAREKKNVQVILAGGLYHESSRIFESSDGLELIKRYRATKAFISASGFRIDLGVTCSDRFEIDVKQTALRSSLQKILLVDSSKFGKVTSCFFANIDEFDMIISDSGLSPTAVEALQESKAQVVFA
jgi:DeoR family deoxyribose operon repressor